MTSGGPTDRGELALLRLVAQRLAGPPAASPAEAVRWLTAVQGQDLPGALASVALRTAGRSRAEVSAALDAGEIVRSWPMRGTLHLVAAEDLGWLLELCAQRAGASAARRQAELGLAGADLVDASELAVAALSGGRALTRVELLTRLTSGGLDVTGQRGYHLLGHLARSGTVCLGPLHGGEQRWVLTAEWIPRPRRLAPEEALRELVLRYFRSHGPATVEDLARWSGLRITELRAAVAALRSELAVLDVGNVEHLLDPRTPELLAGWRQEADEVRLLPGFDEFVLGYRDRRCALPPEFAERVVPGGNGMFRSTVVSGGQLVGTWRWQGRGSGRRVSAEPFTTFDAETAAGIEAAAAAWP